MSLFWPRQSCHSHPTRVLLTNSICEFLGKFHKMDRHWRGGVSPQQLREIMSQLQAITSDRLFVGTSFLHRTKSVASPPIINHAQPHVVPGTLGRSRAHTPQTRNKFARG